MTGVPLYGFRFAGPGLDEASGDAGATRWPVVRTSLRPGRLPGWATGAEPVWRVRGDRGELYLPYGGQRVWLVVGREPRSAEYVSPNGLEPEDLLQPYLGPAAAAFARWEPADVFHAGAFLAGDGAIAVVAGKGGGKSTFLAELALRGNAVLTDDVLVVRGLTAHAGPRSLDLRKPSLRLLGVEGATTPARAGSRWRLPLEAVAPTARLSGWIFLSWGERLEVDPLTLPERLRRISDERARWRLAPNPYRLVELARPPAWELRRPRDGSPVAVVDALLDTVRIAPPSEGLPAS
jgi:hypothetical protein